MRLPGSPKKCAIAEPPRVQADVADAFVDRAPIEWTTLLKQAPSAGDTALLHALQFLESMRRPVEPSQPVDAPGWPIWSAHIVLTCAALQTACGLAVLAVWIAGGGEPLRLPRIALAMAFALGCVQLASVSPDRRRLFLLTAFTCAATAFTRSALAALPADRVVPFDFLFRGLVLESFVPAALWQFALVFPEVRRFTVFDLVARRVAAAAAIVGLLLFTANLAGAFVMPAAAHAAILDREHPARLFWHFFVLGSLPAISTIFVRARRAPLAERRKVAHLAMALAAGTAPFLAMGLARMTLPGFDGWFRAAGPERRVWLDSLIVAGLAATPILSMAAVLVDRPFERRSIFAQGRRDGLERAGLLAIVVAPFLALTVTIYRIRHLAIVEALTMIRPWVPLACISILCVAILARRRLRAVVDGHGRRRSVDRQDRLTAALERVRFARGQRELARVLVRELESELPSCRARLLIRPDNDGLSGQSSNGEGEGFMDSEDGISLPAESALIAILREATRPLDVRHQAVRTLLPNADGEWIARHEIRVLAPLKRREGAIVAIVAVGGPHAGAFDQRDRTFIAGLTSAAASAWDRETASQSSNRRELERIEKDSAFECPKCGWVSSSTPLLCQCRRGAVLCALPDRLAGKFLIERRLGAGGMGVVYLARDITLDRDVALKTLPELREGSVDRLQREARAMARLNHEGLATLYGLERWRRTPVLVVEYFPEGTLAGRLSQGPMSRQAAIELGVRLADALAYMHACGVVHRDLKPSNIGLTVAGAPKLLDFGLATLTDGLHPHPLAGTPAYLPPEASAGSLQDASYDLWALAIVLMEAITGQHPFATTTSRPFDRTPLGSDDVVAFFERALSISPERRFPTAEAFRAALTQLTSSDG